MRATKTQLSVAFLVYSGVYDDPLALSSRTLHVSEGIPVSWALEGRLMVVENSVLLGFERLPRGGD